MVIQVRGGARIIRCVNGHANKKKILHTPTASCDNRGEG